MEILSENKVYLGSIFESAYRLIFIKVQIKIAFSTFYEKMLDDEYSEDDD